MFKANAAFQSTRVGGKHQLWTGKLSISSS